MKYLSFGTFAEKVCHNCLFWMTAQLPTLSPLSLLWSSSFSSHQPDDFFLIVFLFYKFQLCYISNFALCALKSDPTSLVTICHHTVDPLHSFFAHPDSFLLVTTNLISVSMSWFLFCSFVVCLDSTDGWNHMVFVFCPTYFCYCSTFKVHPYSHKWEDFIVFNGWVMFHWIRKLKSIEYCSIE